MYLGSVKDYVDVNSEPLYPTPPIPMIIKTTPKLILELKGSEGHELTDYKEITLDNYTRLIPANKYPSPE